MRIKKSGGKIFGADLTAAERKAMDKEIQRQLEAAGEVFLSGAGSIPRSTGWSWTR